MALSPNPAPPPTAQTIRILWGAMGASALVTSVVMGGLAATTPEPAMADQAEGVFYAVALLNTAALAVAFFVLRKMEDRIVEAASDEAVLPIVQTLGILALAAVEAGAILAAVATFLTGDLLMLAFVAPLLGFIALTWPSESRIARWRSLRRR